MSHHPYKNLPEERFWSSGVKSPVSAQAMLAIDPLLNALVEHDSIVSGGSCFAQYIGQELSSRNFDYLRSNLSGERVESFGLGNIYTITQLKQWLEFSLGYRAWGDECCFEKESLWYDLLLPHRDAMSSKMDLVAHRIAIKEEILSYLKIANVFIFTIGLTETWKNLNGDIYPTCPGTLSGEFDKSRHFFHNCTFEEIYADLVAVEKMLADINSEIKLIYTVSPVPLTATASNSHILIATTFSKSVIRAAVGQYCNQSHGASYFPSYELISHHADADWRFDNNLRSISESGVRYVMAHAFGEDHKRPSANAYVENPLAVDSRQEAICEEELLETYSKLTNSTTSESDIVLIGDCHIGKLASGFAAAGIDVIGGMVMHGSAFTDDKFEMSEKKIFLPLDSKEAREIWLSIHDKLTSFNGSCHIITNIGFQTHRTINTIGNHFRTAVLTEKDIADYFEKNYLGQVQILRELTKYGKVWMVEDPHFHAFLADKDDSQIVRDKNFHQYCRHIRKIAHNLGIEYLNPCDAALQNLFKDAKGLRDIIHPHGFLGTETYYEYCAAVVNASIGNSIAATARAA